MQRYVLKNRAGSPAADPREILVAAGASILDQLDGHALLIEADEETISRLRTALPHWTIAQEATFPLPGMSPVKLRS
jgi:hypothetical protein